VSELDPTEDRLRTELHAIGTPLVNVERLLATGRRRARRRAMRGRAVAGAGAAGLAAAVALSVVPDDGPDAVTGPSTDADPTSTAAPGSVPLGEGTTWPGGPFDPIDGMAAADRDAQPLSGDEIASIYDAEARATSACMADHGYEWRASANNGLRTLRLYLSPAELRAGGLDYEYDWAAAQEFFNDPGGPPLETEGMTPEEELDAYETLGGGSEESIEVGSMVASTGGCMGEARARVFGTVANFLRYNELRQEFARVGDQLRTHDQYAEPLSDWQACMADAGYDVGDHDYGAAWILEAGDARWRETEFNAEAIQAVAEADADCQESSGLYEARESLLATSYEEIAEDLGVDFGHYVAYEHALYERSRQIP
jgi:hypothetical protein